MTGVINSSTLSISYAVGAGGDGVDDVDSVGGDVGDGGGDDVTGGGNEVAVIEFSIEILMGGLLFST